MTYTLDDVKELSGEDRYDYFLTVAAEQRELWILINDEQEFLKLYSDELRLETLLVWPSADLATQYAQSASEALSAKSIALPQFFMKWVAGLEADNLQVNVFPNDSDDAWIMTAKELKSELQDVINSAF